MPACSVDGDREAILEADDRAVVEAEGVLGELAEAAAPQIAREAVRDPEIALVPLAAAWSSAR